MNYNEVGVFQKQKIQLKSLLPEMGLKQVQKEIVAGLSKTNPEISSKYFYDKKGSELFEDITHLNEYYPTRTEQQILNRIAPEIMNRNTEYEIVELGSGDCSKISILLDAVEKENIAGVNYVPVDISESAIKKSAHQLAERFQLLTVKGFVADFIQQFHLIEHSKKVRLICLLGSTIGNFTEKQSKTIIGNLSQAMLPTDSLLMGFDLIKPVSVLEAAYNDKKGVTALFNKNILNVVNNIIDADFKPQNFDHYSFFNSKKSRIEMHLVANKNCRVSSSCLPETLNFQKGDSIHTENSHKYSIATIENLIAETHLKIENIYYDTKKWFALVEFKPGK